MTRQPRTLKDHLPFVEKQLERLGAPVLSHPLEILKVIAGRNDPREADHACARFAETLEWPDMSDTARFEVCCRLACMMWYCCEYPNQTCEGEPGDWFLLSFLDDYWNDVGRRDWIYEGLLEGPSQGFGVEPERR